jgi:hypothetical protein
MIESGTLLAFTAVPFSDAEFTGELNQAVFLESGGTLDFAYQLQDSSSFTDVAGLTVIDFLGSTLDVGTAHGTAPFSGARSVRRQAATVPETRLRFRSALRRSRPEKLRMSS